MNVNRVCTCILCFLCFACPSLEAKPAPSLQAMLAEIEDASSKLSAHETELSLLAERLDEQDTKLQKISSPQEGAVQQKLKHLEVEYKTLEKTVATLTATVKDLQNLVQQKLEEVRTNHKQLSQDLRLLRRSLHALLEDSSLEQSPDFADAVPSHLHVVAPGDTLSKIAARYHLSVAELKKLNKLNSDTIYTGQKLRIRP